MYIIVAIVALSFPAGMTWAYIATNYGDAGDWVALVIVSIMWIGIVIFGFGLLFEKMDRA